MTDDDYCGASVRWRKGQGVKAASRSDLHVALRDGVALEPLVADINARGARHTLVILDASRPNPFERWLGGSSSGLAPIAAPQGPSLTVWS